MVFQVGVHRTKLKYASHLLPVLSVHSDLEPTLCSSFHKGIAELKSSVVMGTDVSVDLLTMLLFTLQVRPIQFCDFVDALDTVKPSVSDKDLDLYLEWNKTFGSGSR